MRSPLIKLFFAVLPLALLPPAAAAARPRAATPPAAGIVVDVSRLRELGLGPTAELVQVSVARELAGGISGPIAGGRILVRITGLSINSFAGSETGGGGGGGGGGGASGGTSYDYLEGDLLVLGARGEVLSQRHQVSSTPSSSGGPYYLPGSERRRVEVISRNFADWLKRTAL